MTAVVRRSEWTHMWLAVLILTLASGSDCGSVLVRGIEDSPMIASGRTGVDGASLAQTIAHTLGVPLPHGEPRTEARALAATDLFFRHKAALIMDFISLEEVDELGVRDHTDMRSYSTSNRGASLPESVGALQDALVRTYHGSALALSASASSSVAAVHGARAESPAAHVLWCDVEEKQLRMGSTDSALSTTLSEVLAEKFTVKEVNGQQVLMLDDEGIYVRMDKGSGRELACEVAFAAVLPSLLAKQPHAAQVRDNVPDLYAISFNSLSLVRGEYGQASREYRAAAALVGRVARELSSSLHEAYDGRLLTVEIYSGPRTAHLYSGRHAAQPWQFVRASENETNDTNTSSNSTDHPRAIAKWQIELWTGVLLIVTAIASVWAMCIMDMGHDSLLYRMTSPKPHAN